MFGSRVCNVAAPEKVLQRIARGMQQVLQDARSDERIPRDTLTQMADVWATGIEHAKDTEEQARQSASPVLRARKLRQ
jgi:serine/threonine-protein kinase HipA